MTDASGHMTTRVPPRRQVYRIFPLRTTSVPYYRLCVPTPRRARGSYRCSVYSFLLKIPLAYLFDSADH